MPNTALNRTGVSLLTNKSGGATAQGDVVVVDTANASAFTTTTTSGFANGFVGVVLEPNGIANNAAGLVAFGVYVPKITLNTAATIGQFIKTHSVAKQGTPHSAPGAVGDFAIALEASASPKALLMGGLPVQGAGGTDSDAIHDNVSGEINAITEKASPVAADLVVIEDSAASYAKKKVQIANLSNASTPNRAYYEYLAALMEPLAIEAAQVDSFSYSLAAGTPKILVASFNTKLGSSGRMEVRNPRNPLILNTGLTLAGLGSGAMAVLIDPSLATYTDAEATYHARLNSLASDSALAQKVVNFSAAQTVDFLPGPYGSLIVQLTSHDYNWIVARPYGTSVGWNLWDEIGDATIQRLGDALIIPVSKNVVSKLVSSGAGGIGTVVYVVLPSTWGLVTDSTSYDFRDDFMGATLDTGADWTRTQTAAGQMEIDTAFQWLKAVGNGNWGQNGIYSQSSIAKANGKVFLCDVYTPQSWGANGLGMVGFSDGGGQSYTNLAYAVNFGANSGSPELNVYENGNARGAVGSAFSLSSIYRVRITCAGSGTSGATYQIQGGSQYPAIGSASWTDITPGTTSSATTTLHAGVTMFQDTLYVSDVKMY